MNETIYQLAERGESIRIVVQKKKDGDFVIGVSNGKYQPLICQGKRETVGTDFEQRLPQYLEDLKAAAIDEKLSAATEELEETLLPDDEEPEEDRIPDDAELKLAEPSEEDEQLDLEFGF